MPPGYWDLLSALGYEGIANNLKQTSFGKYGRQADQPKFKPSWAKNKLRSTDSGAKIRQGQYDDSPNKFSRRGVVTNAALAELESLELDPSQQEQYRASPNASYSPATANRAYAAHASRISSSSAKALPPAPAVHNVEEDYEDEEEEEYDEEEIVDDDEEYEDEAAAPVDSEVQDLQRILAEKMAELARLQAGG
jgi:hypothetical protein